MQRYPTRFLRISLAHVSGTESVKSFTDSHILRGPDSPSPHQFHILRAIRELYDVNEELFQLNGNVIFANFYQTRLLARQMNEHRDIVRFPETAVKAGQINAMGLIDEILHFVLELYNRSCGGTIFTDALETCEEKLGKEELESVLKRFVELYPSIPVYRDGIPVEEYLQASTEGIPNRALVLEEIVMLSLANDNPAFYPFLELFNDAELKESTAYTRLLTELEIYFDTTPAFGPENQQILEMIQTPAREYPDSLSGQLEYMREHWGMLLGKFMLRLLRGLDFISEEEKPRFEGPGPTHVPVFSDEEFEKFSKDREWMPKVVMLAKSTYVWLDQLSRRYKTNIHRLDMIPDEELDRISGRGFTGLWLIGLWERSSASKRIKHICGNPEAEASAYSLMNYEIAGDLGGWEALHQLKERCWRRGIRLASDMVPNHTGIDSEWVIRHPDWFVQLSHPPYPHYSYHGEDLCGDESVSIYLEDHYYNRSDAAVTFKRVDNRSGETRYIYHGNDGTSTPWNDTAQLNFLNAETREAVIQTILHVARNFSVIRFDAAMTLAKKHIQRLWFPVPGSGGDVPSRAEHGLSSEEFNRLIPEEFWREVVDRIQQEVPDTLLLAEAFWMMESYFVRTLGMHRVYNSAFMNMLKNEENEKYRLSVKNTIEFDPGILKRYVNFMNNPDEETAIAQFGEGDKYFGVCTLLVTMPGLPMFGHGQIEGYREKYGMEYRKAYWAEDENGEMITRHEREIFPLMKMRYLFADSENFLFYDFYTPEGSVNENVFAYSNSCGEERAIVLYNNSFHETHGWIMMSTPYAVTESGGGRHMERKSLYQGLYLDGGSDCLLVFQEQRSGLWYIRSCTHIRSDGLFASLRGYQSQVFINFRTLYDDEFGHYHQLENELNGAGTPDIERSLREIVMRPVHKLFTMVLTPEDISELLSDWRRSKTPGELYLEDLNERYTDFIHGAAEFLLAPEQDDKPKKREKILLRAEEQFRKELGRFIDTGNFFRECEKKDEYYRKMKRTCGSPGLLLLLHSFLAPLSIFFTGEEESGEEAHSVSPAAAAFDELLLAVPLLKILPALPPFQEMVSLDLKPERLMEQLKILHILDVLPADEENHLSRQSQEKLFGIDDIAGFIGENRYESVLYFHKESFEELIWLIYIRSCMLGKKHTALTKEITLLENAALQSGYRTELYLRLITSARKRIGRREKKDSPPSDTPARPGPDDSSAGK